MIRRVSAVFALALALAGCGGGDEPAKPDAADGAAAPAIAQRPAGFAQCAMCHSVEPGRNGIGPSLAGVFGATAAHEPSFAYSSAMRESGLVWDETTLDAYLANPRDTVPGTKMSYQGLRDEAQRAELIEWLKTI